MFGIAPFSQWGMSMLFFKKRCCFKEEHLFSCMRVWCIWPSLYTVLRWLLMSLFSLCLQEKIEGDLFCLLIVHSKLVLLKPEKTYSIAEIYQE